MRYLTLAILTFFFHSRQLKAQKNLEIPTGSEYTARKYLSIVPQSVYGALQSMLLYKNKKIKKFKNSNLDSSLIHGIIGGEKRLDKYWGFQTGSRLTAYFHENKIYAPKTMKTVILMAFHQILNDGSIRVNRIMRKSRRRHRKLEKKYRKKYQNGAIYCFNQVVNLDYEGYKKISFTAAQTGL